jgi:hypothetical protein
MTEKQSTGIMYEEIWPVAFIERDGLFNIYKNNDREDYMVCKIDGDDSEVSPVFHTIEEAREWSQQ